MGLLWWVGFIVCDCCCCCCWCYKQGHSISCFVSANRRREARKRLLLSSLAEDPISILVSLSLFFLFLFHVISLTWLSSYTYCCLKLLLLFIQDDTFYNYSLSLSLHFEVLGVLCLIWVLLPPWSFPFFGIKKKYIYIYSGLFLVFIVFLVLHNFIVVHTLCNFSQVAFLIWVCSLFRLSFFFSNLCLLLKKKKKFVAFCS